MLIKENIKESNMSKIKKLTFEGGNARAMPAGFSAVDANANDSVITYSGRKAYADRLEFGKIQRKLFIEEMISALRELNKFVRKGSEDGLGIWSPEKFEALANSRGIFLGSSEHLFNLQDIDDEEYSRHKKWTGDLDIAAPAGRVKVLNNVLEGNENLKLSEKIYYVGRNRGPSENQTSSCIFAYHSDELQHPIFVQVDFMSLDFSDAGPDDFSRFSRSSSWDDIKAGVKGVFHKFLLSSLTNAIFERSDVAILTPSSIKRGIEKGPENFKVSATSPEKGKLSTHSFHILSGMRNSLEPVSDPKTGLQYVLPDARAAFRKLESSESISIKDLRIIFQKLFGKEPDGSDLRKFSSFIGLIELIEENKPEIAEKVFIKFVVGKLFGRSSQALYASDPNADMTTKMAAVNLFLERFPALQSKMEFVEKLKEEFYQNYKIRDVSNESYYIGSSRLRNIVKNIISEALASDEREFISGTEFEKYFDRNNEFTGPKANQRHDQQVYQRDDKKESPGNWANVKERAMEEYKKDLAKRRRAGLEFGDATNLISKYFASLASFMRFRKEVLPRLSRRYEELSAKKSLSPEAARERLYCLEAIKTNEIFGEVLKSSVKDFASRVTADREKSLVAKDDTVSLRPSEKDQAALAFGRQFSALSPERRSQLAASLGKK